MSKGSKTTSGSLRRLRFDIARGILTGTREVPGVVEMALGFRTSTTGIKPVHIMNDLAQCVLGGAPSHGGDFVCRILREEAEREPNSEQDLRADPKFGQAFNRAYPISLGHKRITLLRRAADVVLNADKGIYAPGIAMASSLATHRDLLGFEGYRRFHVGWYLAHILGEDGRRKVRELYLSDSDPVSRALRPIFLEAPLVEKQPCPEGMPPLTPFDESLGRGLACLLSQPLSKPTLLRYFAIASTLGLLLKVLGVGRPDGRPVILALPLHDDEGPMPLREQAVQSIKLATDDLFAHLARFLPKHPLADTLWSNVASDEEEAIEVTARDLAACSADIIAAVRTRKPDKDREKDKDEEKEKDIYWPDAFITALGRKSGIVFPKSGGFGWGKRLVLSGELLEILILMFVPPGQTESWRNVWMRIRGHLGLVIGAQAHLDAEILENARLLHVSLEDLSNSSTVLLEQAVRRGVARKLPDKGAQVGGEFA